jgi:osmoprotectant transport system permease protein
VLTTIGLLYTIPSLGLFALLWAVFGIPYLSENNLIIALTVYGVAIMTRSVTDGLDSVDAVTRDAAIAVGYGPGDGSGPSTCRWRVRCCSRAFA